jgi:hypothetical protein
MEDDLNYFENGRWPQFFLNGSQPQFFFNGRRQLFHNGRQLIFCVNFLFVNERWLFFAMEDDYLFVNGRRLLFFVNERRLICWYMEDDYFFGRLNIKILRTNLKLWENKVYHYSKK